MSKPVFIYITNPSKKEAKRLAKHLIEKRLIACANIFPIESLYWWKNKL
jgi:periplasmic divalent cation tolerance protein